MIQVGSDVKGINFDGKNIEGKVENIVGFNQVVIVRTGKDRLDLAYCSINNLKEK